MSRSPGASARRHQTLGRKLKPPAAAPSSLPALAWLLPWFFYAACLPLAIFYPVESMDFSRELGFGADKSLLDDMAGANGTKAFLTSPAFWAVQAAVAASFLLIKRVAGRYGGPSAGAAGVEDTNNLYEERMENLVMHWHLSNALIWSFFFDALSGLFAVLPKMRVIYYKLDARHLLDIDMRAGLDAVYWAELCIHVPLCYIAFLLHLYKRPSRGVIDVAVSGIQLCGCFIYYVSGVYDNGKYWFNGEPVIFFTGTVLGGLAWMIVPMLVIWRHMRLEAERHGHQSLAHGRSRSSAARKKSQ